MEKIIWQPTGVYQPGAGFDVFLNTDFAREMLAAEVGGKNKTL